MRVILRDNMILMLITRARYATFRARVLRMRSAAATRRKNTQECAVRRTRADAHALREVRRHAWQR